MSRREKLWKIHHKHRRVQFSNKRQGWSQITPSSSLWHILGTPISIDLLLFLCFFARFTFHFPRICHQTNIDSDVDCRDALIIRDNNPLWHIVKESIAFSLAPFQMPTVALNVVFAENRIFTGEYLKGTVLLDSADPDTVVQEFFAEIRGIGKR